VVPEDAQLQTSAGDDTWLHVRAGSYLLIDIGALNRDPFHWERPDEFFPEHFTEEAQKQRSTFAYLPFSVGGKSCLGSRFALLEAQLIAVLVLHRFQLRPDPAHRLDVRWYLTAKPTDGVRLLLTPRWSD
jgi:unspecific monooxygenase